MQCNMLGKPRPSSFYWKKDGIEISHTSSDKFVIVSVDNPSLTIVNVDKGNEGSYSCHSKVGDSEYSASTKLSVICGK